MKRKVKLTVIDKKLYPEPQRQHCADPNPGRVPVTTWATSLSFTAYGEYTLLGGHPAEITGDMPQFQKDYIDFYKTEHGYHPRSIGSNGGFAAIAIGSRLLDYTAEIRSPVLLIHGENADSRPRRESVCPRFDLRGGCDENALCDLRRRASCASSLTHVLRVGRQCDGGEQAVSKTGAVHLTETASQTRRNVAPFERF